MHLDRRRVNVAHGVEQSLGLFVDRIHHPRVRFSDVGDTESGGQV